MTYFLYDLRCEKFVVAKSDLECYYIGEERIMKKLKEKISIFTVKNPRVTILTIIIILNIIILLSSSMIINVLMKKTAGNVGLLKTIYYTIGMILDAGMIENVINDIGSANVILVIVCLITIVMGSISFTGAIIGYVTNYISAFIENANSNLRKLHISNHVVILNWNSRASEIINEMLYLNKKENIIVLVNENAEKVLKEINERIYVTLNEKKGLKNKLNIIVREGSTFSTKQLHDISLPMAKTIIILGDDDINNYCQYDVIERRRYSKENANTIKTLVQVSEMTAAENSMDGQKIVVEVEDQWTRTVVDKIISHKENLKKCNIVPVPVNCILGQILSQFCIFPELNRVYNELFSNDGAEFFCKSILEDKNEKCLIEEKLYCNDAIIPLTTLNTKSGRNFYYMAYKEDDISKSTCVEKQNVVVDINLKYWLEKRNIIILGHNSKVRDIMEGFNAFRAEWNRKDEVDILNILVIDDQRSLENLNYYREYTYVNKVVEAEIYDTDLIKDTINQFIDQNVEDTSILVLSDDMVKEKDVDAFALTNLIYIQDIIYTRLKENPEFDTDTIDVIVEILNPKNYDVVHSYNIDNIVISNRYISKMVTQIGQKIELYEFYEDILTYDTEGCEGYESKEVYIKPVKGFLYGVPPKCKVRDLIYAVYECSPEDNKSYLMGVARHGGTIELFCGDKSDEWIELLDTDKLIIYSNH